MTTNPPATSATAVATGMPMRVHLHDRREASVLFICTPPKYCLRHRESAASRTADTRWRAGGGGHIGGRDSSSDVLPSRGRNRLNCRPKECPRPRGPRRHPKSLTEGISTMDPPAVSRALQCLSSILDFPSTTVNRLIDV